MGDYNTIRGQEDRPVGKPVQEAEVRDLNEFMEQNGLTEIRIVGRRFTWTNGHTYSRIDRAIVNIVWMLQIPQLEVRVMDPGCSDHSPLSIKFEENAERESRPFKFLNHLAEHKEFLARVKEAWQKGNEQNKMKDVWCRLKRVKQSMKVLNRAEYNKVDNKISRCRQQLAEL
ncbi:uncharacterized protein LOC142178559 [Nicotiana tabacum]|uniref:Uncharacterized protein LOC142178559 n=1 Tax=Nicotiana tabacum TaxID=4097 RepID=A0AC58U4P3_TOBAC